LFRDRPKDVLAAGAPPMPAVSPFLAIQAFAYQHLDIRLVADPLASGLTPRPLKIVSRNPG